MSQLPPSFNPQRSVQVVGRHLMRLMQPAVGWAVRKGMGHGHVARLLKPLFLREAHAILQREGRAPSDSALALAAGLHRGDIHHIHAQWRSGASEALLDTITVSQQVLANWVIAGLPASIPFKNGLTSNDALALTSAPAGSFSDLVHQTPKAGSQGFSPRLVLQDMVRQGLVTEHAGRVTLQSFGAEGPYAAGQEQAIEHLSAAGRDLLAAGLHNLQAPVHERFLEQSLEVDGLHPESVQVFQSQAEAQWQNLLAALVPQAKGLSDHDEPRGGQTRLRLGIYFYAEPQTAKVQSQAP